MKRILVWISIVAATTCVAARPAATGFDLKLRLAVGDRLFEHHYQTDRVEWKLPKRRLQPFIRAGVIIHEERHTVAVLRARVDAVQDGTATLSGDVSASTLDVPRHENTTVHQTFVARLTGNNLPQPLDHPAIEDAAAIGLPRHAVRIGSCWDVRTPVTTELGSGFVLFHHCLQSRDGDLLRISISGNGTITGSEYHLPKLLPGSIEVVGAAWYDLANGLITQESYRIHDRLLKPAEHERIGFDQILDVDVSTRRQ